MVLPVGNVVSAECVSPVLNNTLELIRNAAMFPICFALEFRIRSRNPLRRSQRAIGAVRAQVKKLRKLNELYTFFHPSSKWVIVAPLNVTA